MRRVVEFLVLAFLIFFVVTQPRSAAHAVHTVGHMLREAAESTTLFLRELN